jgi:hypothetical protein
LSCSVIHSEFTKLLGSGFDAREAQSRWSHHRLQAHFDAGASHVCIQPLHPEGQSVSDDAALTALAAA